jgi:hypothetical protein
LGQVGNKHEEGLRFDHFLEPAKWQTFHGSAWALRLQWHSKLVAAFIFVPDFQFSIIFDDPH